MAKTIKEIADEIGVSKQAVYKRFKGKLHTVCAPYAHTERGTVYIDEYGENLIKQDFLKNEHFAETEPYMYTERSNEAVLEKNKQTDLIALLQTTIDTLQEQLKVKDGQIEQQEKIITKLTDSLAIAQQTATAVQALNAGMLQKQILSSNNEKKQQNQDCEQKRGLISRLFGR